MLNYVKRGGLRPLWILVSGALSLPLLFLLWVGLYAFMPTYLPAVGETGVIITPDLYFPAIEKRLGEAGLIEPDPRFKITARLMGVADTLKAGEYVFEGSITPYRVLRKLSRGSSFQRPVTIPEGADLKQIAKILGEKDWVNPTRFLELVHDRDFIRTLGFDLDSLEGYLFPETYLFVRGGHSAEDIIKTMTGQMRKVLAETGADKGLPSAGLTPHEIVTLASIVEKETGQPQERPLIARVFLNRLQRGMRLQSDPTVIYGIEEFDGNLTRIHLRENTPYNTYQIAGLPPGPIGNPGRAAIEAIMHPAEDSYYYFVSKNDGSHYFSRTLDEHNRAVAQYQKRRRTIKRGN